MDEIKQKVQDLELALNYVCYDAELIFDPYMGTGTTAIAAIKEKRKFIGSEISSKYCQIANKRIKNEISTLSLF